MSAEQVLDNVMRHAAEAQAADAPCADAAWQGAVSNNTALEELKVTVKTTEATFETASDNHALSLSWGIPALVVSFVILAAKQEQLFGAVPDLPITGLIWRVAILWTLPLTLAACLYFFIFHRQYVKAQAALDKARQDYLAERCATTEGRRQYLHEELFRLSNKVTFVFHGDQERLDKASERAALADKSLDDRDKPAELSAAQGYLNSLNELVTREEREQADENRWQKWAIAVMFLYVSLLIAAALLTNKTPGLLKAAAFGVPLSVILWGAAGSLAAILFRFYKEKEQGQIRFALEFRWLIARPIIGIIMGAVVYLALTSGLVLISTSGGAPADPAVSAEGAITSSGVRMEAFWIIAFLAGFSDKFYLGVINLLVAHTVPTQEKDSNTVTEEKKRIPEGSFGEQPGDQKQLPQPSTV